jgi:hypothetical protein
LDLHGSSICSHTMHNIISHYFGTLPLSFETTWGREEGRRG